jgi:transposase InsO family protein
MDLFSRRSIGWSMQATLASSLVLNALQMALHQRAPHEQVLHHSDRGSQYASDDYQGVLAAAGMRCSMSRKGDCFDNAPVERFFGTLKTELVYHQQYATRSEARSAMFEDLEVFSQSAAATFGARLPQPSGIRSAPVHAADYSTRGLTMCP